MIDKQFDNIIKQKLSNMTDTSSSDWSTFEQKLSNENSTSQSGEGFDNAIKQKLAGIPAASGSSDWSTFEHMLDEDQLTDQMLDDKVSAEMNSMRAPYRHDHWEMLHDNLELQKTRNQNIIGYKIIELSLLFLLLLSANNLYKYLPSTFEIEKPKIYANLDSASNQAVIEAKKQLDHTNTSNQNIGSEQKQAEASNTPTLISTNAYQPAFTNQLTASKNLKADGKPERIASKDLVLLPLATTTDIQSNTDQSILEKIAFANTEIVNLATLNTISTSLEYDRKIHNARGGLLTSITPAHKASGKSLSAYIGIDNNLVNSPFDNVYDVEGFRTYGIGYSAGVDYNIKKGNKEYTVGVGYSNRSYEPRIIDELTGDAVVNLFDTSLEHIEFDILSLTAGLRFGLWESDKWSVDLGIGASANIVASTNYTIETVSIIRDGKFVSSRVGRPSGLDLDAKPLHDGIYEGGSLKENIYLTTDLSIGLRRMLSDNTALTIRPEYSLHSFSNGIGPNNDLINNLSLNLGVQYML